MSIAIALEIALKSALIAGAALALLAALKRRAAAQRAFVAHVGLALSLLTPLWVLFGPRLELTGPWSRTPPPIAEALSVITTAPASTTIAPAARMVDAEAIALGVYALVAVLLLALLATSLWRLLRLQRDAAVLTEPSWLCALAQAQQRMGMKQGTALLQNGRLSSPVSWGFLRPTIMVNPSILQSADKAEAVLAHELAHVVRHDWLNLLIARLATSVLWFNPLVWLLAWQAHELREEAADDVVLRGNVRRSDYAALLVDFARQERTSPLAAAHGVSPAKDVLKRRLTRVLDPEARRDPAAPAWALACTVIAALIAAPVAAFTPIDHAPQIAAAVAEIRTAGVEMRAHAQAQSQAQAQAQSTQAAEARATAEVHAVRDRGGPVSAQTLIAMRANGVTAGYIERVERTYPPARHMDYDDFISFRALGVTPEWLRGMAAAGYGNLSPGQVRGFAAVGVSPAYIRDLEAAGLAHATPDELVGLRANNVTSAYVREIAAAGLSNLSADDVLELRVTGAFGPDISRIGPRRDRWPFAPRSGRDDDLAGGPPHPPDPPAPPREN